MDDEKSIIFRLALTLLIYRRLSDYHKLSTAYAQCAQRLDWANRALLPAVWGPFILIVEVKAAGKLPHALRGQRSAHFPFSLTGWLHYAFNSDSTREVAGNLFRMGLLH